MKKTFAVLLFFFWSLTVTLFAASDRTVLVNEGLLSESSYYIIARGYPKAELTDPIQIANSAQEAAVMNAQILARERFSLELDVIKNGSAEEYITGDGFIDVKYVIQYPGIKKFLLKKPVSDIPAE